MTIEMDERVIELLKSLHAQAEARSISFVNYLEQLVATQMDLASPYPVSLAMFDQILDELCADNLGTPSLPADFSRADIYADHD